MVLALNILDIENIQSDLSAKLKMSQKHWWSSIVQCTVSICSIFCIYAQTQYKEHSWYNDLGIRAWPLLVGWLGHYAYCTIFGIQYIFHTGKKTFTNEFKFLVLNLISPSIYWCFPPLILLYLQVCKLWRQCLATVYSIYNIQYKIIYIRYTSLLYIFCLYSCYCQYSSILVMQKAKLTSFLPLYTSLVMIDQAASLA